MRTGGRPLVSELLISFAWRAISKMETTGPARRLGFPQDQPHTQPGLELRQPTGLADSQHPEQHGFRCSPESSRRGWSQLAFTGAPLDEPVSRLAVHQQPVLSPQSRGWRAQIASRTTGDARQCDLCDRASIARRAVLSCSGERKTPRYLALIVESPSGLTRGAFCKPNCASVRTGFFWLPKSAETRTLVAEFRVSVLVLSAVSLSSG